MQNKQFKPSFSHTILILSQFIEKFWKLMTMEEKKILKDSISSAAKCLIECMEKYQNTSAAELKEYFSNFLSIYLLAKQLNVATINLSLISDIFKVQCCMTIRKQHYK